MLQDTIFLIGNCIFIFSLIPTILENEKVQRCDIPYSTSIITGGVIFMFSISFASINLWFSAISAFFVGIAWSIIALQRWRINK